jgi:thiamine biosynthesis lipoprotein
MGTSYTVKYLLAEGSPTASELEPVVAGLLEQVNDQMSTYRPESELSRFNRQESTDWFGVSAELAGVVAAALEVSRSTGGAFDVTVGPLVNLWGFGPGPRTYRLPPAEEVQAVLAEVGFGKLQVRSDPPALRKSRPALYVDLSALAKGHGVDRVAELLESRGIDDYMVEIGGEIRARGVNVRGVPWRIAVEKPTPAGRAPYGVLSLRDVGVATSGDYRNFFEVEGRRFSHTIDPLSGYPVDNPPASVTVLHPSAMYADAYATALMVMGEGGGMDLANELGLAAMFIARADSGLEDRRSTSFDQYWEPEP